MLEKTIAFQEQVSLLVGFLRGLHRSLHFTLFQTHLKNVKHRKMTIEQLKRQATLKSDKTAVLDTQTSDMDVMVADKKHIYDRIGIYD